MTRTHTSYEVSKRLKEFLGESAPEPMDKGLDSRSWYSPNHACPCRYQEPGGFPIYQLHDLLSRPFCEVMSLKIYGTNMWDLKVFRQLSNLYFSGGLPAVEAELMKMMEAK